MSCTFQRGVVWTFSDFGQTDVWQWRKVNKKRINKANWRRKQNESLFSVLLTTYEPFAKESVLNEGEEISSVSTDAGKVKRCCWVNLRRLEGILPPASRNESVGRSGVSFQLIMKNGDDNEIFPPSESHVDFFSSTLSFVRPPQLHFTATS